MQSQQPRRGGGSRQRDHHDGPFLAQQIESGGASGTGGWADRLALSPVRETALRILMTTTCLHVFTVRPRPSGTKWVAAGQGQPLFSEEYGTKEAAFAAARVHARGHRPSEVAVYRRDGTIE